jgi:hypothetical protein
MPPSTPKAPKVLSAEVVATRPTAADSAMIAGLAADARLSLREVAYVVKIRLKEVPPATALGWALYAGDVRIPKYWEYSDGIYFKVLDPAFLAEHRGKPLRFSQNGQVFVDTGVKLPGPGGPEGKRAASLSALPRQEDVLSGNDSAPARTARPKRAARKRSSRNA